MPVRRESDEVKEMAEQKMAQPRARCGAQLWFTGREKQVFNRAEWDVSDQRPTLAKHPGSSGRRKTTQIWNPGPIEQSSRERGSAHVLLLIMEELQEGSAMSKLREEVDGTPEASRSSMEPQEQQAMLKYNYLTKETLSKVWDGRKWFLND